MLALEILIGVAILLIVLLVLSTVTVKEGTVAVITTFGKYKKILRPGLSFVRPFVDKVFTRVSIQKQSIELEFTSITNDQANVDFKTTFLYCVKDDQEETIKRVAFSFINEQSFMQALIRGVEGTIRAFVATKRQNEILALRNEIVDEVQQRMDAQLEDWGYDLIDLQLNDIIFDEAIMRSMAQVVASENLKRAAENEGEASLITKTKAAEAEKITSILQGEGVAQMRTTLTEAMVEDAKKLEKIGLDASFLFFSTWIEGIKDVAQHGEGNVIFMDGSSDGMEKMMKQAQAMSLLKH